MSRQRRVEVPTCECDGWCKGRRYTCGTCKRFVPFCFGGDPGIECNSCWAKSAEESRKSDG